MFIKLKDHKIVSGFSQTQLNILFSFYLDDIFLSIHHHQATFKKLIIRFVECKWHSRSMGSKKALTLRLPD